MTSFPSLCQTTRKTVIETHWDGVASHHRLAGEAGAEVLRSGEDAPLRTPRRTRPPHAFACPAGVSREAGRNSAFIEIMSPHGDAALEDRQETE